LQTSDLKIIKKLKFFEFFSVCPVNINRIIEVGKQIFKEYGIIQLAVSCVSYFFDKAFYDLLNLRGWLLIINRKC
jgi:hypothetical protein